MSFSVPPTRTEAVLSQLRAEIISGVLAPGEVLKDGEVAARMGVSITPVREAIAQLAHEGLVEVSPNRWRRVAQMNLDEAVATLDMQFILYAGAVERALPNLSDDDLVRLRELLEDMGTAVKRSRPAAAASAVAEIFGMAVDRAANPDLKAVWKMVFGRGRRFMGLSGSSNLWDLWVAGFTTVVEAMESRDVEAAVRSVRAMAAQVHEQTLSPDAHGYVLGSPSPPE
ncbi:GntR family transcriptional regulator [Streptomyces sp. NPDC046805]|uniref:GntR family transcriptional regulator n=1 Tax=Streptomyces sp. NPDC046805 TaxID=3155134 RepID=UPI0033FCEAD4